MVKIKYSNYSFFFVKCLTLLPIREREIESTLRFHPIQVRITVIKKTTNADHDVDKSETIYIVARNIN